MKDNICVSENFTDKKGESNNGIAFATIFHQHLYHNKTLKKKDLTYFRC